MPVTMFDDISQQFSSTVNQTREFIRVPLFFKLIGEIKNKDVADFGCGDGFFTKILAKNSAKSIIGVDCSGLLIKEALKKRKP